MHWASPNSGSIQQNHFKLRQTNLQCRRYWFYNKENWKFGEYPASLLLVNDPHGKTRSAVNENQCVESTAVDFKCFCSNASIQIPAEFKRLNSNSSYQSTVAFTNPIPIKRKSMVAPCPSSPRARHQTRSSPTFRRLPPWSLRSPCPSSPSHRHQTRSSSAVHRLPP